MFTLTFCHILFSYRGCRWGGAVRFFLLCSMTFSKYLGTIFGLILLYRVMCWSVRFLGSSLCGCQHANEWRHCHCHPATVVVVESISVLWVRTGKAPLVGSGEEGTGWLLQPFRLLDAFAFLPRRKGVLYMRSRFDWSRFDRIMAAVTLVLYGSAEYTGATILVLVQRANGLNHPHPYLPVLNFHPLVTVTW